MKVEKRLLPRGMRKYGNNMNQIGASRHQLGRTRRCEVGCGCAGFRREEIEGHVREPGPMAIILSLSADFVRLCYRVFTNTAFIYPSLLATVCPDMQCIHSFRKTMPQG